MKFLLTFLTCLTAASGQGPVRVTKVPAPNKALIFEAKVPASLDAVWVAFTTNDGLSAWLAPEAVVELRDGGEWTAHFPGGSTGGGTILSFTPKSRIVMSAMAPDAFPNVRKERTTATWEFVALDAGSTRVTLKQTGWKEEIGRASCRERVLMPV